MTTAILGLFDSGMTLSSMQRFLFMLPLCLSIAVVYKTTRCEQLSDVPVAAGVLWVTIVGGMYAVGLGLWILFSIAV